MAVDELHPEVIYDGCGGDLEVGEPQVLAQATPGPAVEGCELVARLVPDPAAAGQPPLRPVLPAVVAPYPLHSAHGVDAEEDPGALGHPRAVRQHVVGARLLLLERRGRVQAQCLQHRRVEVGRRPERVGVEHDRFAAAARGVGAQRLELGEDLVLHVRVRAEHVEEPGERGRDEVLGRDHVADGGVAEEPVPLPVGHGGVPGPRHVHGQQVAALSFSSGERFCLAFRDLEVDELVEHRLGFGEPPLDADVEPPQQLPPASRHDVPEHDGLPGDPGRLAEGRVRGVGRGDGQRVEVGGEHHGVGDVQREAHEHVLELDGASGFGGVVQERHQEPRRLPRDGGYDKGAEHGGGEDGGDDLPLPRPGHGVRI
uniref:Uncharacterized protein n=1 Tax=Triticum urartu TaxID=4572 RepID=A0A8R7JXU3_TRIUA